jgi:DNA-binding transcriptional MocR family regulator
VLVGQPAQFVDRNKLLRVTRSALGLNVDLMFQVVKNSSKPLGDQLVDELARLIESGRLTAGSRLPSVRKLARRAGVSPYTVAIAFERLQALGLIEARPGSGHFIAAATRLLAPTAVELGPAPSGDAALGFVRSLDDAGIKLPAGCGFLPPTWFAEAIPPSILSRVRSSGALSLPTARQGDPILRELLVERLRARGVPAAARHILVTKGASQAFDLIARTLLAPGDTAQPDRH